MVVFIWDLYGDLPCGGKVYGVYGLSQIVSYRYFCWFVNRKGVT